MKPITTWRELGEFEAMVRQSERAMAATDNRRMAKKRGYSNEFPTDQSKRIKREIDWVPPALDRSLRAKLKREGLSLRTLTLRLWSDWVSGGTEKAG